MTMQIKALNCPNCGASIPDTSKACSHCGSTVVLTHDGTKFVLAGVVCPGCGFENQEGSRFCSKCRQRLLMECPECKKDVILDAVFCSFCGIDINERLINIIKKNGSSFKSRYPQYKHKFENMKNEMLKSDEEYKSALIRASYDDIKSLRVKNVNDQKKLYWFFLLCAGPVGLFLFPLFGLFNESVMTIFGLLSLVLIFYILITEMHKELFGLTLWAKIRGRRRKVNRLYKYIEELKRTNSEEVRSSQVAAN
jgi:hypothetical protein